MFHSFNLRQHWISLLVLVAAGLWLVSVNDHRTNQHFDVKNISLAEANTLINAGALVIDVRDQDKFNFRHIPGAILIPLEALRVAIPASILAAKDRTIIVYCNEGLAPGPEGTALLQKAGFKSAVNLESGIEGWARSGLPIQKG